MTKIDGIAARGRAVHKRVRWRLRSSLHNPFRLPSIVVTHVCSILTDGSRPTYIRSQRGLQCKGRMSSRPRSRCCSQSKVSRRRRITRSSSTGIRRSAPKAADTSRERETSRYGHRGLELELLEGADSAEKGELIFRTEPRKFAFVLVPAM